MRTLDASVCVIDVSLHIGTLQCKCTCTHDEETNQSIITTNPFSPNVSTFSYHCRIQYSHNQKESDEGITLVCSAINGYAVGKKL